ncbi:transmembrane protein 17B-like [Gigantopelta aegis]|uniref:transmembrane protein 17B-like n=1 Tax=Gigantopelta aegis TaxID=1735272 RepID=UPI001B889854|nr:transmembrane protein 17B-like [Gigantopelta aegis]
MDATFRRTMTNLTDVLFPVKKDARDPQRVQLLKTGNEYVTNLPLQMALYFNVFFSPLWAISSIVILAAKFDSLDVLYQIILTAVYVAYMVIEIIRLYLGYVGNLMERVPELAGFWLLTLLLQFPLIAVLLLNEQSKILPLERAMHIVKALFIVFEMICGYFAIRIMVDYQVTKFHLQQFTDMHLEKIEAPKNTYYPETRYNC